MASSILIGNCLIKVFYTLFSKIKNKSFLHTHVQLCKARTHSSFNFKYCLLVEAFLKEIVFER